MTPLPDRRREVASSPELDAAVSQILALAREVKARRHRGPVGADEAVRFEDGLIACVDALEDAVHAALDLPHP